MNKKLIVIIATLLIVSAIVFIFIPKYIEMLDKNTIDVYFTKSYIQKGTAITFDMLQPKTVNKAGLDLTSPSRVIQVDTKNGNKEIMNSFASYDMVPGEMLMLSKLTSNDVADAGYMYALKKGYYALPIKTDLDSTGAGILQPGDLIDLYFITKDRNIGDTAGFERVGNGFVGTNEKLRRLEILDLRNQMGSIATAPDKSILGSGSKQDKTPRVLILKLDDKQIRELMKFESLGSTIKIVFNSRNPEALKEDEILVDLSNGQIIQDNQDNQDMQDNQENNNN